LAVTRYANDMRLAKLSFRPTPWHPPIWN